MLIVVFCLVATASLCLTVVIVGLIINKTSKKKVPMMKSILEYLDTHGETSILTIATELNIMPVDLKKILGEMTKKDLISESDGKVTTTFFGQNIYQKILKGNQDWV